MINLNGLPILVTGAGGFLGHVVAAYLEQQGAMVTATYRTLPSALKSTRLIQLDLEKADELIALDAIGPFHAIVHCAALLPGELADVEMLTKNQRMTYQLVNWALGHDVKHFLFLSSCSIYGYSSQPCNESMQPNTVNLYAVSKLACEHIISSMTHNSHLQCCHLRVSAPYGPHLRAKTVVKRFIDQAMRGETITLLGSGKRSQDFVYEGDVARACALAIEHTAAGIFNISGDHSVSMQELATTILELCQKEPKVAMCYAGTDPQEAYRGLYPIAEATKSFNYEPQVGLAEGLRRTIAALGEV